MILQDERSDASHWQQQQERDSPTKKPAHKSAGKLLRPSQQQAQQQVGQQCQERAKHTSLASASCCCDHSFVKDPTMTAQPAGQTSHRLGGFHSTQTGKQRQQVTENMHMQCPALPSIPIKLTFLISRVGSLPTDFLFQHTCLFAKLSP